MRRKPRSLAGAAVSDVRGFCDRQPDACVVGGKVAVALGHKAEAGARTIYEFITTKLEREIGARRKSRRQTGPGFAAGTANGTLTPADMAPAWHAPVPLPPRREARAGRPSA